MIMKNKKQKGSNAERELVEMFWEKGFSAVRVAGSGTSKFPCPDVVASNGQLTFQLNVKVTQEVMFICSEDKLRSLLSSRKNSEQFQ